MRTRKSRDRKRVVEGELQILPMMNLFVVLIPMLLLSAVFLRMAVINMSLPADDDREESADESLGLAVRIEDEGYVVESNAGQPTVIPRDSAEVMAASLAEALHGLAEAYPDEKNVTIISQPHTEYDEIVRVMDVSRDAGLPYSSLAAAGGASL